MEEQIYLRYSQLVSLNHQSENMLRAHLDISQVNVQWTVPVAQYGRSEGICTRISSYTVRGRHGRA